ncbi:MAG: hypothetical protein ACOH14_06320 [Rhodoglobus sp.]
MAVRPGERYDRSTYLDDGSVYDWVSCLLCKAVTDLVFEWAPYGDDGISPDDYREWATEMCNDVVHGEAARAWLLRAGITLANPQTNNTTTPAALAESTTQKNAEVVQ